jgi:hypothetical protein
MKYILLLTSLLFMSCSHSVHLVNLSDFEMDKKASKGKPISVQTEQFVILGFVSDTNYVDNAKKQLINKCPNGSIKNIRTRYSTSHGFFSWHNKINMEALCF